MLEKIDSFEIENLMLSADENGIVQVVLSRAKKRNALNAQTIEELIEVFSRLPRMGARAIVLKAEGDHFCAGLDLIEHHNDCLLYTSPSPRDPNRSRMPSSA